MSKESKRYFSVEFPLICDIRLTNELNKRMEICRRLYNQCVKITTSRYNEMVKTRKFRELWDALVTEKKRKEEEKISKKTDEEKRIYSELNKMYKDNGFTEFGMQDVTRLQLNKMQSGLPLKSKNIDTGVAQSIGQDLWTAWQKKLFSDGEKVYFKKYGSQKTARGKNNRTGIIFKRNFESASWEGKKDALTWFGLEIPVKIDWDNPYEAMAFENRIVYNTIVKKVIRGKDRFFLQILFEGVPYEKVDSQTGEFKHPCGEGVVAISVTPEKAVIASDDGIKIHDLAPSVDAIEEKMADINRKLDKSRRATNPERYNEDGTINTSVKGGWYKSNRYIKLENKYRELSRKNAYVRKLDHFVLANEIISKGDKFIITDSSIKSLQMRDKDKTQLVDLSLGRTMKEGEAIPEKAAVVEADASYSKVYVSSKLIKALKKKKNVILVIKNDEGAVMFDHDAISKLPKADTHPNKGKEIANKAPFQMITLLQMKADMKGCITEKKTPSDADALAEAERIAERYSEYGEDIQSAVITAMANYISESAC